MEQTETNPSAPTEINGKVVDILPYGAESINACEPIFEDHPGWTDSTFGVDTWEGLPKNAQAYLKRIEALVGANIDLVSTGPDRTQTIVIRHPLEN